MDNGAASVLSQDSDDILEDWKQSSLVKPRDPKAAPPSYDDLAQENHRLSRMVESLDSQMKALIKEKNQVSVERTMEREKRLIAEKDRAHADGMTCAFREMLERLQQDLVERIADGN